jgi:SAM-dependent methyltransferase
MRSLRSILRVRALVRQKVFGHSTQQIFSRMYHRNSWANPESASGDGSDLDQTRIVRRELATLIQQRAIGTLLDAPCGDYYWMKTLEAKLARYIGADIVPELIEANQRAYGGATVSFRHLDICRDELPAVDLIFCRDCLVHLPLQAAVGALRNFKKSGSRFLLTTTYPGLVKRNADLFITGNWRPLDLTLAPFSLPEPVQIINEGCTEKDDFKEKSLGLWDLAQVQI